VGTNDTRQRRNNDARRRCGFARYDQPQLGEALVCLHNDYHVIRYLTGACGKSSAAPDTTGAIVNAPPKSGAGRRLLERATGDVSINLVQ